MTLQQIIYQLKRLSRRINNTNSKLTISEYANDGAAEAGGVPIGGLYHTSGTVKVRVS